MKNNKEKMYDFEIESFTEADLYEEQLTTKEIMKLKKDMFKTINLIKNLNKELNIDIDLEDSLKIRKELGKENEVIEYGVKNAKLLKKIVLDAIDKEVKDKGVKIIDEVFVPTQIAISGRVDTVMLHGCPYFYKMYLTNNRLIVYSLSDKYKVLKKRVIKFDELNSIGKAVKSNKWWSKGLSVYANTYSGNQSYIEPQDRSTMYLNHTDTKYKEDTLRFLDKLSEVGGVKINKDLRMDITDYIGMAGYIALFLLLIGIVAKIALNI